MSKKATELQGPTKIKKLHSKILKNDFKDDTKTAKHKKELDENFDKNANKLKQYDNLVPYKGFVMKKEIIFIFIFTII